MDRDAWRGEFDAIGAYLGEYGERLPQALARELHESMQRLHAR